MVCRSRAGARGEAATPNVSEHAHDALCTRQPRPRVSPKSSVGLSLCVCHYVAIEYCNSQSSETSPHGHILPVTMLQLSKAVL